MVISMGNKNYHRNVYFKNKLVYGFGINDADYPVKPVIKLGSTKRNTCKYYQKWKSMLERCYSEKYQIAQPTYIGCTVCDEWRYFSKFKSWLESQGSELGRDFELDKDILNTGNKVYSPEKCVLVPMIVNRFLINGAYSKKSNSSLGSSSDKITGKFRAYCKNPFTSKGEYLGIFKTDSEAHLAWKKRKHELACQLADLQTDERVANALRNRYL